MPMIQELKRLGYANVRFYSYQRWTHTLVLVLYQEMPFKARTGQALVYPRISWREYGLDMLPKAGSERTFILDEWAASAMSVREIAANFADQYLEGQSPDEGGYNVEYYDWLDLVMAACPPLAFPITEEPVPGGPYDFGETIKFYGVEGVCCSSDIPRPPGLSGMLEPRQEMLSAIAWAHERAKAKEPSPFQKWNRGLKHPEG